MTGCKLTSLICAVNSCQATQAKLKVVPARLSQVFSQLVQQGLPGMDACGIDQRDVSQLFYPVACATG